MQNTPPLDGVVGLLLAAGDSSRFGSDKRFATLDDGTTLLRTAARKLAAACDHCLVVVRADDAALPRIEEQLADCHCQLLPSVAAAQGMGHSIAAGVAATATAHGWLIALADMPWIAATTYQRLVRALRDGASLARPAYQGQQGHPVAFAARWRQDLCALSGARGAQALITSAGAALEVCNTDDRGILLDVDHPLELNTSLRVCHEN